MYVFLLIMILMATALIIYVVKLILEECKDYRDFIKRKASIVAGSKWLYLSPYEDTENPFYDTPKSVREVIDIKTNENGQKYVKCRKGLLYKDGTEVLGLGEESMKIEQFAKKYTWLNK